MTTKDPGVQRFLAAKHGLSTDDPKAMQEVLSEALRVRLEENDDPFAAWSHLNWCVDNAQDFPDWLIAYLRDVSAKIHSLVHEKHGQEHEAKLVGQALGFGAAGRGKPGKVTDARIYERNFQIAFRIVMRVLTDGEKPYIIAEPVGKEFNVNTSTAMKAYSANKAQAFSIIENLSAFSAYGTD